MLCDHHAYPTLPARDIERARRFYEGALGFEPEMVTTAGVLYNARGSRVLLYPSTFAGTNQATACGFEVDDLPAMVAELKGRGVKFEEYEVPGYKTVDGIVSGPEGDAAWFKDTEGNIVGLFQPQKTMPWPRDTATSGARA